MADVMEHRHGPVRHAHHHHGPHRHGLIPFRSHDGEPAHHHAHGDDHDHDHVGQVHEDHVHDHAHGDDIGHGDRVGPVHEDHVHDHAHGDDVGHGDDHEPGHVHDRGHGHGHGGHGHTHGRIDPSIVRSRAGLRAVGWSLLVLGVTAALQAVVFMASGSVALLADLIHNVGDALTAVPLGIAFVVRKERAERWAGYAVVGAIFISASVAGVEAVDRLIHPQTLDHLGAIAIAGLVGFLGNEVAAQIRLRAGARLASPALIADGHHARVDGLVSLGVVLAAGLVALGVPRADPLVGLAITVLILRITWQAWHTVRDG